MKIAIAGQGAFGTQHIKAIQNIPDIEVISLTGGRPAGTEEFATTWKIPHWTNDLAETLKQPGLEGSMVAFHPTDSARRATGSMSRPPPNTAMARGGRITSTSVPVVHVTGWRKEGELRDFAARLREFRGPGRVWVTEGDWGQLRFLREQGVAVEEYFIYTWNDFYGPLVFLAGSTDSQTLSVALSSFRGVHHVNWNLTMAAALIFMIPAIVTAFVPG